MVSSVKISNIIPFYTPPVTQVLLLFYMGVQGPYEKNRNGIRIIQSLDVSVCVRGGGAG
jgi:hypothetical protein